MEVPHIISYHNTHSVSSKAVAEALGVKYDDNALVDLSNIVNKSIGITDVKARRKGQIVYMEIRGSYTGNQTTSTQPNIITGLPSKYIPKTNQIGIVLLGYNATQFLSVGRCDLLTNGNMNLSETAWLTGTNIRASFLYLIN